MIHGTFVEYRLLHPDAQVPRPAHGYEEDAGADLCSVETMSLRPGETRLVPTGLAIALRPGFEAQIRSRSGLAMKYKVHVLNSPGTIDPGYRGKVGVLLHNAGDDWFQISVGDRIAQIVIARYEAVYWQLCDDSVKQPLTLRNAGGFGSTGV